MANSAARKLLSELALKFNPNHDEQGRFAEGPGLGELKLKAVTAREFTHARDSGSKRPGYLSPKTTQEVHQEIQQGGKARLGADGKVGYLLTKQGDLQNLFNNGGPKGAGVRAAIHAVSDGAKTLDCFDGYLRRTYQALGFEEVGRVKFNDDYAPPHWDYQHDGRPDVVFMEYRGDTRNPNTIWRRYLEAKRTEAQRDGSHHRGDARSVGGGAASTARRSVDAGECASPPSRERLLAELVKYALKFNPNHDPDTGRFSDGDGSSSQTSQARTPEFSRWFANSKVVDKNGDPLVVYHGSHEAFDTFDYDKVGAANDPGYAGAGFYFIDDPEWASGYAEITPNSGSDSGGNVKAVYLSLQNPKVTDRYPDELSRVDKITVEDAKKYTDKLKSQGYDGIIIRSTGVNEYVAFDSRQIKSATGNRGTFDPDDPDITKAPRLKFNPNHDPTNGQFSEGGGSGTSQGSQSSGGGSKPAASSDSGSVSGRGGVSGSSLRVESPRLAATVTAPPLAGLPTKVKVPGKGEVEIGPNPRARLAAAAYMEHAGIPYNPPTEYVNVDKDRAARIAQEYDAMKDDPQNPEVKAAYAQMIKETLDQYQFVKATGLKIEPIDYAKQGNPYAASPRLAELDVQENNHLWYFRTADGFGSDHKFDASKNPLLADSGEKINGQPLLVNDVFRIVHDYFGHIKEGNGFRADGEENAWRSHSAMYSDLARKAVTSETRGQNSWVNFGPYGESNRTAKEGETHFADQKTGLLLDWCVSEGSGQPGAKKSVKEPGHDVSDEARDESGKWTSGGSSGGGSGGGGSSGPAAREYHAQGTRAPRFKQWFGDWEKHPESASKVVKNGEPQEQHGTHSVVMKDDLPEVVYHGTNAKFTAFDSSKNDKTALYGPGMYFTEDKAVADSYQQKGMDGVEVDNAKLKSLEDWVSKRLPDGWQKEREYDTEGRGRMLFSSPDGNTSFVLGRNGGGNSYLDLKKADSAPQLLGWDETTTSKFQSKVDAIKPDMSGMHTIAAYLNIRNPFRVDGRMGDKEIASQFGDDVQKEISSHYGYTADKEGKYDNQLVYNALCQVGYDRSMRSGDKTETSATVAGKLGATQILRDAGYDGITHIGGNIQGDHEHHVWIAFDPTQVKAVDNDGTFDPNNPDFTKCGKLAIGENTMPSVITSAAEIEVKSPGEKTTKLDTKGARLTNMQKAHLKSACGLMDDSASHPQATEGHKGMMAQAKKCVKSYWGDDDDPDDYYDDPDWDGDIDEVPGYREVDAIPKGMSAEAYKSMHKACHIVKAAYHMDDTCEGQKALLHRCFNRLKCAMHSKGEDSMDGPMMDDVPSMTSTEVIEKALALPFAESEHDKLESFHKNFGLLLDISRAQREADEHERVLNALQLL